MIGPGTGVRVYLACGTTDMRKGIAGLSVIAQDVLRQVDHNVGLIIASSAPSDGPRRRVTCYLGEPDLLWRGALEGELRSVLQDQDGTVGCLDAQGGGGEMALEDLVLADIPVGKETVGGLGVRPVLEGRYAQKLVTLDQAAA